MSTNERWARDSADQFRSEHHLGTAPIKDVFEMVHLAIGVDVFSIRAAESEHGLSMLDPETGRRAIVVATTAHPMRQRSSVLHELGHLIRGDLEAPPDGQPGERSPSEICADAFARHLLLPLQVIRERYRPHQVSLADLSDLVQGYGTSPAIAAIQLKTTRRISQDIYEDWSQLTTRHLAVQFGWLGQYSSMAESSNEPRAPQRLMQRAVAAYRAGALGLAELSRWYGQSAEGLRAELGDPQEADSVEDDWGLSAPLFPSDEGDAPA
ncbi:MAG: ImmA/IrrE family metallo-endopeptidase [Kineosporiaceae bacterium]|nr:ImmA/IrrE family metallo-endopeptidase [Kineosporiaceae bacterium]